MVISGVLIIVYIIELIIFSLFDTRKNGFNKWINVIALLTATYLTFQEFGWSLMLLVPTLGALVLGGIIGGFVAAKSKNNTRINIHTDTK